MEFTNRSSKRTVLSVVLAIMMVFTMVPAMAFAAQGDATVGTVSINDAPVTLNAGVQETMTATISGTDGNAHVDWTSSNSAVATINKHKGELTAVGTGDTVITATLRPGAKPGQGHGNECSTAVLATATFNLHVNPATAYGYQGEGGNSLLMVDPSNVTFKGTGTFDNKTVYKNKIRGVTVSADNTATFRFKLSAGGNRALKPEEKAKINKNIAIDKIYNSDTNTNIQFNPDLDPSTGEITITVPNMTSGPHTLEFLPECGVIGKSGDKNIGSYIYFEFTI